MLRPMVRQVERQARRLHDMIKALGVDEIALIREDGGEGYAQAREKCLRCASAGDCLHWLEAHTEGSEQSAIPEYCRNKDLFEKCRG